MARTVVFGVVLGGLCGLIANLGVARADDAAAESDAKVYQQLVQRGVDYLLTKGQAEDGSFATKMGGGPGVTAICTSALLRHGRSPDDPAVVKAIKYILKFAHDDGGVYSPGGEVKNYETSLVVVCLSEANADGRYKKELEAADKFLKSIQWGGQESDVNYGGAGYGRHKRPDLSNTGFFMDALKAAGNGPDDEAVKRALVFVSRCQNLESAANTTQFAAKNPDGGFYYTPAADGGSEAGSTPEGGLRSYGSMTYAGLKSMIYAGVKADDPRVKAAVEWVKKHYTVDGNPGMPKPDDGHYYYLHTMTKALAAMGVDQLEDEKGVKHDWRHDVITELAKLQKPDGSWINVSPRWVEGDPNLVTAYALLSLSYAKPK